MYAVEITAVAGGLIATVVYTATGSGASWAVVSASVMIAVASLGTGGLVGILFGVPRTNGSEPRQPTADGTPGISAIGANTNLEQISDWLTKILVGVGLTQFGAIKREAGQLFHSLAPALGDAKGAAPFAGSIVIYFFVVGFLSGWLYARLRLGLLMSTTDALLELSRRADRAGDVQTAQVAKEIAKTQLTLSAEGMATSRGATADLISRYEELRRTMAPGPRRTAEMEDLVRRARQLTQTERFTTLDVSQLFNQETEGCRIVALALMEGDLGLASLAPVLDGIRSSKSAFEQYHALTVANLLAASLNPSDRAELLALLESTTISRDWTGDSGRERLVNSLLTQLRSN